MAGLHAKHLWFALFVGLDLLFLAFLAGVFRRRSDDDKERYDWELRERVCDEPFIDLELGLIH